MGREWVLLLMGWYKAPEEDGTGEAGARGRRFGCSEGCGIWEEMR